MLLYDLVETSRRAAETTRRLEKTELLASCLRRAGPDDVPICVAYLSGEIPQGRIGIGPATLKAAWPETSASSPSLTLTVTDGYFQRVVDAAGPGSTKIRARLVRDLLQQGTREEQDFLARLLFGELRQGALEGIMTEAIASAFRVPAGDVRRALMLTGDLGAVAHAALTLGSPGLGGFGLRMFRPLKPMLAQSADRVEDALERLGIAALEWKLDGARVQVHRSGSEVRVFTRQLNDVTGTVPELVEAALGLPVQEIVLDGEALALRRDGRPLPFQLTMRRFGRKLDVPRMRAKLPLTTFFFDCLYLDGETLIDLAAEERFRRLSAALPESLVVPRIVTGDAHAAASFLAGARQGGHEGLVAKALAAPYEAGRRGAGWVKVKPAHTLDLVVLGAEWGHGRRRGWLSNLHLGARDPETGSFVMLGKTFKGFTDELLTWQTRALQEIEIARDRYTVYVEPKWVVEVAFNEVQASSRYPAGLALRFARVRGYRHDKRPEDADTIDTVRDIFRRGVAGE